MLLTDADQLRKALAIAMRERDELHAFSKELESNVRRLARERDEARAALVGETSVSLDFQKQRDEARAEVERLRFVEDCRGDGLTYECNLTRPCVACRLRAVAERQREACELYLRAKAEEIMDDGGERGLAIALHRAADRVEATPLVTEGES